MNISIKRLGKESIGEVLKISLSIFKPKDRKERHHNPRVWESYLDQGGLLFGAFEEDKLVGYNFGYPVNEKEYHYWMGGVLEEYRGFGIGRLLLEKMEEGIRKLGFSEVTVNTYEKLWTVQFEFLKRHGYKITDQKEVDWEDGTKNVKTFFSKQL